MKLLTAILAAACLFTAPLRAVDPNNSFRTPLMRTVAPSMAKAGGNIVITGNNLDKLRLSEVYLSDGKMNTPLVIVSQSEKTVECKLPVDIKSGRYSFVVLLTDNPPTFLEEPLKIVIQ